MVVTVSSSLWARLAESNGHYGQFRHPDLGITARLIYSYFLSNMAILTAAESNFVGIAGMIPQDVSCHST